MRCAVEEVVFTGDALGPARVLVPSAGCLIELLAAAADMSRPGRWSSSRQDFAQPPADDLVFVTAHHPNGDQQFSFARPLHVDRRISREQLLGDLLRGYALGRIRPTGP